MENMLCNYNCIYRGIITSPTVTFECSLRFQFETNSTGMENRFAWNRIKKAHQNILAMGRMLYCVIH